MREHLFNEGKRARGRSNARKDSIYMTEREWYQLLAARVRYQSAKAAHKERAAIGKAVGDEKDKPNRSSFRNRGAKPSGFVKAKRGHTLNELQRKSIAGKVDAGGRTFSRRVSIDLIKLSQKYGQSTIGHQSFGLMRLVRMHARYIDVPSSSHTESVKRDSASLLSTVSNKECSEDYETDSANSLEQEIAKKNRLERDEDLRALKNQLDEQKNYFKKVEEKNKQITMQLRQERTDLENKLNTLTLKVSKLNDLKNTTTYTPEQLYEQATLEASPLQWEEPCSDLNGGGANTPLESVVAGPEEQETPEEEHASQAKEVVEDWDRLVDPDSGLTYYYHHTTCESQWEPPMVVVEDSAAKLQRWYKKVHPSGKAKVNSANQEDHNVQDAEDVKRQESMIQEPSGFIERVDTAQADSVQVTAVPSNGVESRTAGEVADVVPSETEGGVESPGDERQSSEDVAAESEFTGNDDETGAEQDEMDPSWEPVYHSKEWSKVKGDDGTCYYYNSTTGESQWEVPESLAKKAAIRIQSVMRGRLARESILTLMAYNYLERQKAAVKIQKALRGWTTRRGLLKRVESESALEIQRVVRGHLSRKKTRVLREKTVAYLSPNVKLNPDWEECIDPISGSLYYVNNDTGEISWKSPEAKSDSVDKMFDVQLEDGSGRTGSEIDFEDKTSSNDNPLQDLFAELEDEDSSFEHDTKTDSLDKESGLQSPGEETTYELADEDIDAMFEIAAEVSNELEQASEENSEVQAPLTPSGILNRRGKKVSLQVKTQSDSSHGDGELNVQWSSGASGLATPTGKQVGEWVEKIDAETGEVYYFNCATEECRWEAPTDFMRRAGVTQGRNKETWDAIYSSAGDLLFWYNWSTGKSQNEEPALQRHHLGSISEESTIDLNALSYGSSKTEESRGRRSRFTLASSSKSKTNLQSQRLWTLIHRSSRILKSHGEWHLMQDTNSLAKYYSNITTGAFQWEQPEEWSEEDARPFVDQSEHEPEALTFEGIASASVAGLRWKSSSHVTRSWSSIASPSGKCLFEFNWETGEVRKSLNTRIQQVISSRLHTLQNYPDQDSEMGSSDYVLWTIVLERSVMTQKTERGEERLDELSGEVFTVEKDDDGEEVFKWCEKKTNAAGNGWTMIESLDGEATYWYNGATGETTFADPN